MGWLKDAFFINSVSPRNVTIMSAPRGAIRPDNIGLADQRGWRKKGTGYAGPYAPGKFGTWHGRIERIGDTFRVLIYRPPVALRSHPKWHCMHDAGSDWWSIHLNTVPADHSIDAIISYVEKIMVEAFTTYT